MHFGLTRLPGYHDVVGSRLGPGLVQVWESPDIQRETTMVSVVVSWISTALMVQLSTGFITPRHYGSFPSRSERLVERSSASACQKKFRYMQCCRRHANVWLQSSVDDQANEAIESLRRFHVGQWTGRAISFSVTNDVAAGVVRRNISRKYTSTMEVSTRGFQETIAFDDVLRSVDVNFESSQMDVDAVDASYSLDQAEDIVNLLPPETLDAVPDIGFCVEHCLVAGDNQRVRCFAIYDIDEQLARIIVSNEERVGDPQPTTSKNETKRQWQSTMISSTADDAKALEPMTATLLELTSGVWLGDAIVRDNLSVLMSPMEKKGFGETKFSAVPFASWSVGVQKIAWRWLWDFEEEIRQVVDLGKVLGSEMLGTDQFNVIGAVIANESMSRRIIREERIVFIDWERDSVSFLVGPVAIQVCLDSCCARTCSSSTVLLVRSPVSLSLTIQDGSAHFTPTCACFKPQRTAQSAFAPS